MSNSFNLVVNRWIPVLRTNGKFSRVGICDALAEAGEIRQIAASNPMDNVALLRFLLAVLYWCEGNPPEQKEKARILADGHFPAGWFLKLEERRDCFDLLGEGNRLYQCATAKRERATTDLLQEIPTGNNFWHFRHSTDGLAGLCSPCCAMGLIRLPLFSVSGLPDLKAGINGTPPIYVLPIGQSLLHTLCLNWASYELLGAPAWDLSAEPSNDQPVPLLDGLTRLSRRVWLRDPTLPDGHCVSCGTEQSSLIRTCEYQSAGKQQSEDWTDPHVIYVDKRAKGGEVARKAMTTPDLTKSFFRMDKPWASLLIEILSSTKSRRESEPVQLLIVGFATDKAKNIDVWERTWFVQPPEPGHIKGLAPAEAIRLWNEEGTNLPARLRPKGRSSRGTEFIVATTAVRPQVESRVSSRIAGPDYSWTAAVEEWRQLMAVAARSLAPGFTTQAVQRRNEIARAVPDMTSKPPAKPRRPGAKKGGDK